MHPGPGQLSTVAQERLAENAVKRGIREGEDTGEPTCHRPRYSFILSLCTRCAPDPPNFKQVEQGIEPVLYEVKYKVHNFVRRGKHTSRKSRARETARASKNSLNRDNPPWPRLNLNEAQ